MANKFINTPPPRQEWLDGDPEQAEQYILEADSRTQFMERLSETNNQSLFQTLLNMWENINFLKENGGGGGGTIVLDDGFEYIYASTEMAKLAPGDLPSNDWGFMEPGITGDNIVWSVEETAINAGMRYRWRARRAIGAGLSPGDDVEAQWAAPVIVATWSVDGSDGQDGAGIEYIFCRYHLETLPAAFLPDDTWKYDEPGRVGGMQTTLAWVSNKDELPAGTTHVWEARRIYSSTRDRWGNWDAPVRRTYAQATGRNTANLLEYVFAPAPTTSLDTRLRPDNSWAFETGGIASYGTPGITWHDGAPALDDVYQILFRCQRRVDGTPAKGATVYDANDPTTHWSDPTIVGRWGRRGVKGINGLDGLGPEFIFCRFDADTLPSGFNPDNSWGYDRPGSRKVGQKTVTWQDGAPDLTRTFKFMYVSMRTLTGQPNPGDPVYISTDPRTHWTPPSIISRFIEGQDGEDGVGPEYIFCRYTSDTLPSGFNPDNAWGYDAPGSKTVNGVTVAWSDEAPELNRTFKVLFRARRTVTGQPATGGKVYVAADTRTHWTQPSVAARFIEGQDGEDGVGPEYIFCVYNSATLPTGLRPLNSWGYDSPGSRTSGSNSVTWHDDPPALTQEGQYLFRAQRIATGGPDKGDAVYVAADTRTHWTVPKVVGRWIKGQDGEDGQGVEYIFCAYTASVLPARFRPDNAWKFDQPGAKTASGETVTWGDDAPALDVTNAYLFRAQRRTSGYPDAGDTVYDSSNPETAWSLPKNLGKYSEAIDGVGAEYIFCRYTGDTLPAGFHPDNAWKYDQPGSKKVGQVTVTWQDDLPDLTSTYKILFRCQRRVQGFPDAGDTVYDSSDSRTAWSAPKVVGRFSEGQDGVDGVGVEYIFCRFNSDTLPSGFHPDNTWKYDQPGSRTVNSKKVTWRDDAPSLSKTQNTLFRSQRKTTGFPSAGDTVYDTSDADTAWTTPKVVGRYIVGSDGADGVGYEYVFARYGSETLPANRRPLNSWTFDSPGTVGTGASAVQWHDAGPSLTPTLNILFRSQRKVFGTPAKGTTVYDANDSETHWSVPAIVGRYGQDGQDGDSGLSTESVWLLYDERVLPNQVYPLNKWGFNRGGDTEETYRGRIWTWETDPPAVNRLFRYVFEARRTYRGILQDGDSVSNNWSAPRLAYAYGDPGDASDTVDFERWFPWAHGFPYDNRRNNANVATSGGGYWYAKGYLEDGEVTLQWYDNAGDVPGNPTRFWRAHRNVQRSTPGPWDVTNQPSSSNSQDTSTFEFIYADASGTNLQSQLDRRLWPDDSWAVDSPGIKSYMKDAFGGVTELRFTIRDDDGLDISRYFESDTMKNFPRVVGIRRYRNDDEYDTVAFKTIGKTVSGADSNDRIIHYRIPVERLKTLDEGTPANVSPTVNTEYTVYLLLPQIVLNQSLFSSRVPGWFRMEVDATTAAAMANYADADKTVWTGTAKAYADSATPGDNLVGDVVTLYRGGLSQTRSWDGDNWVGYDSFIGGNLLVSGTILARHLAANAITADAIDAGAVTSDKIFAGAVSAEKIAADAISSNKIQANAVTAEKLAADAINVRNTLTVGQGLAFGERAVCTANVYGGTIPDDEDPKDWDIIFEFHEKGTSGNGFLIRFSSLSSGSNRAQVTFASDTQMNIAIRADGTGFKVSDIVNAINAARRNSKQLIEARRPDRADSEAKIIVAPSWSVSNCVLAGGEDDTLNVTEIDGGQITTGIVTAEHIDADVQNTKVLWNGHRYQTNNVVSYELGEGWYEYDNFYISGFTTKEGIAVSINVPRIKIPYRLYADNSNLRAEGGSAGYPVFGSRIPASTQPAYFGSQGDASKGGALWIRIWRRDNNRCWIGVPSIDEGTILQIIGIRQPD